MKELAVVIIAHKTKPDNYEQIALRQCFKYLHRYPVHLLLPEGTDPEEYLAIAPGLIVRFVKGNWLSNYSLFNRYKFSLEFYTQFNDYEWVLFYELDAFIFHGDVKKWMAMGYDNIGGPWFKKDTNEFVNTSGNGGLCLRNVQKSIRVLKREKKLFSPNVLFKIFKDLEFHKTKRYKKDILKLLFPLYVPAFELIRKYPFNEDIFWAKVAPMIDKSFKTAPPAIAMQFAFDSKPEVVFKLNKENLPFGCHGWSKPDYLAFWKPIIEKEGHIL